MERDTNTISLLPLNVSCEEEQSGDGAATPNCSASHHPTIGQGCIENGEPLPVGVCQQVNCNGVDPEHGSILSSKLWFGANRQARSEFNSVESRQ